MPPLEENTGGNIGGENRIELSPESRRIIDEVLNNTAASFFRPTFILSHLIHSQIQIYPMRLERPMKKLIF